MPSLAQVLARPRKASRQSRPGSLRVPPLILRLVTWQRMSFSEPLVWSGISGRSSTISNSGLLACSRCEQAVERGEAGAAAEDAVEPGAQLGLRRGVGIGAVGLEVGVEPPDQAAHCCLGGAMLVGEGIKLMHQPLGMDPAQGVATDVELAGIVADDHGILEEAMGFDAAPQRALGGDLDRIGRHEGGDAEPVEMRLPGGRIGKLRVGVAGQAGDHRSGQRMLAHVGRKPRR